jgi:hypothetical protein
MLIAVLLREKEPAETDMSSPISSVRPRGGKRYLAGDALRGTAFAI